VYRYTLYLCTLLTSHDAGELCGPPITGAIYSATSSWHCVIAFSGTVQIAGALSLLYGESFQDLAFSEMSEESDS
jgi:hypothetical protein